MSNKPYYFAYEYRYRSVYGEGIERWGHSPDDEILVDTLTKFVCDNQLQNKKIIEFACGEGACGEILSELGCIYHGVDIAPSAIKKATNVLKSYPNASVSLHDMVNSLITDTFDAALDVMGLHMIILDADRAKYLKNAFNCLKNNAPMLFFRESCQINAPTEKIRTLDDWMQITGEDYKTPQKRTVNQNGIDKEVFIPFVPARARTKHDYIKEMNEAGFIVDDFIEMDINEQCVYSSTFYVHKTSK